MSPPHPSDVVLLPNAGQSEKERAGFCRGGRKSASAGWTLGGGGKVMPAQQGKTGYLLFGDAFRTDRAPDYASPGSFTLQSRLALVGW